jgi:DNA-binding NarL/FixJ family response regulator
MYLGFTLRETEVLSHLQQGKANKTIAYELNMALSTVKVHVRNIMKKLSATNRTQVVASLNSGTGARRTDG